MIYYVIVYNRYLSDWPINLFLKKSTDTPPCMSSLVMSKKLFTDINKAKHKSCQYLVIEETTALTLTG